MSQAAHYIEEAEKLMRMEQFNEAFKCLDQALALDPENAQAWFLKGGLYCLPDELENRAYCYESCARFAGEMAFLPLFNLGNTLQAMGRIDEAIVAFARALQADPFQADAWINMGRLMDDSGNHQGAITAYDQALLSEPEDDMAWANRGNSLRALLRYEEALESYGKALNFNQKNIAALIGVSACLGQMRQAELALQIIEPVSQAVVDATIQVEKSIILLILHRHAEALTAIDRAIMLGCDLPQVWNNRGEIMAKLNRTDEAVQSMDRALELDPYFASAWFGKARILCNAGKQDDARQAICRYFEFSGGNDELQEAAAALHSYLRSSAA